MSHRRSMLAAIALVLAVAVAVATLALVADRWLQAQPVDVSAPIIPGDR